MIRQHLHKLYCAEAKLDRAKKRMNDAASLLAFRSHEFSRARVQLKNARQQFRKKTKLGSKNLTGRSGKKAIN